MRRAAGPRVARGRSAWAFGERRGARGGRRVRAARSGVCVCAGVSAVPLPGIPPQPGQRGASPRGWRHVTGRAARPPSPRLLWVLSDPASRGGGCAEVPAEPCWWGKEGKNMESPPGLPLLKIDRLRLWWGRARPAPFAGP